MTALCAIVRLLRYQGSDQATKTMFIDFRPGIPKTRSETRSDLRIALLAVIALVLLIGLLPEAGRDSGTSASQAPLAASSVNAKPTPHP